MGQYKLWLHYREIDQQLNTQLTQLTAQLNALKEQAKIIDEGLSLSENPIIQSLLAQHVPATPPEEAQQTTAPTTPVSEVSPVPTRSNLPSSRSTSGKNGWSHRASFLPLPSTAMPDALPGTRPTSTPHPELDLLPEDITAFVDEHTQTAPLRTPPWWLRKTPANAATPAGSFRDFKDQQSERTNHLVQRWFERWGRSPDESRREDWQQ